MTTTKVVIRLLDLEGLLLGWVSHEAAMRGDGMLRAAGVVSVPIESSGRPMVVSLHWADLNVESRVPWPSDAPETVKAGESVALFTNDAPVIKLGEPPVGLPAVTLRKPVEVTVPVGQMGLLSNVW